MNQSVMSSVENIFRDPKDLIVKNVDTNVGGKGPRQNKKFVIASIGPWSYLRHKKTSNMTYVRESSVEQLTKFVAGSYMKNVITIDCPELSNKTQPLLFNAGESVKDIIRESKRILRYTGDKNFTFKATAGPISMYCEINSIENEDTLGIMLTLHNELDMMTISHVLYSAGSEDSELMDISGPVVMSENRKRADVLLRTYLLNMPSVSDGTMTMSVDILSNLQCAIKGMRKKIDTPKENPANRASHNKMEMFAIKQCCQFITKDTHMIGIPSVIEWSFKGSVNSLSEFDEMADGYIAAGKHTDTNPLVDLSTREFKYITNYVAKKSYMTDDPSCVNVDMVKAISNSRYGASFMYPIMVNGEEVVSQLVFILNDDKGKLFLQIPGKDIVFFVYALFDDMREFNMISNIVTINISAGITNFNILPDSADKMDELIPVEYRTLEDVWKLIYKICAMFITIYERPERTRVVREVTKPKHRGDGKLTNEKDYVIRRILKTRTEAKEYVTRMSGQCADREYTMESWNRVGHTRQLKSGKIVYVHECECKRRLPLSDKEIHLKL